MCAVNEHSTFVAPKSTPDVCHGLVSRCEAQTITHPTKKEMSWELTPMLVQWLKATTTTAPSLEKSLGRARGLGVRQYTHHISSSSVTPTQKPESLAARGWAVVLGGRLGNACGVGACESIRLPEDVLRDGGKTDTVAMKLV